MKSSIYVVNKKQTASFRIVSLMLAIAPLWLILAAANTSALAQTSNDVSSASTASSPADWTQFHRDNMQRWNPYETVLGVNNVGGLRLKWARPSVIFDSESPSSPAVVNGVVYFGSIDGVHALNADTGSTLWSFAAGGVTSSPAVVNGVVYIGSGDSNVYALNSSTGAKLWSYATVTNGISYIVLSSPTVANGVVYIGSDDQSFYALNASTGTKLWSYLTGGPVISSPAIASGVIYFGSDDSNVYALNATTGAKLWSYATGSVVISSPAVADGVVYVGSYDGNVYALNAGTGALIWKYATGNPVYSSPAVANGVVYFGSFDGNVYALNASTGTRQWSYAAGYAVKNSPAIANGVVYVSNSDLGTNDIGNIYALNANTGAPLWSYRTGYVNSSPTIVDGVFYIRAGGRKGSSNYGYVYAFSVGGADLFLRISPSTTTVYQGDLLTYAFPVWNLGPVAASQEVLNTQVPAGTTFDYIRISGTPGLGTCTTPPYQGTGQIVCHENSAMAPNTTWTVRLTVKVTAAAGTVITESAATLADTPDPNLANNTATVSATVQ